ncbi:glycosyltransferase family 2 protein [Grimontia kaedaensis]|uniref:Glycosyltransferase family 2 protein n=1 Tax=Grimontia kaedaensis TaxID=2872157 RepID=A0ABY4X1G8_9GAMM|nr:glycosyltransferase family 2 protein [Grimontia kaedaensis]USH05092.1 glycosyltransferase family 2 protein [Grimontia kaedaensis]
MGYELIFWLTATSIALVIYHHLGYPLLLKMLVRCTPKTAAKDIAQPKHTELPTITVLMPAYNEAQWIAEKIRNLAMLDYPAHKLEVVVACDGCIDETAQIARRASKEMVCRHLNVRVIEYPDNHGKVAVLNKAMATIRSDLVAMSDISALISYDALRLAAKRFQSKEVGVVNSRYCFLNPSEEEQQYWNYQNKIQRNEAQVGSALGAHGALYFIRRELFRPLALDTINDDFILPMKIVAQGYRADVLEDIRAVELEASSHSQDFRRRLRIGAGNCQQLFRLFECLHPSHRGVAFTFASGKALRVLMPFLMLIALAGSIYLAQTHLFFMAAAAGQFSLYSIVAIYQLVGCQPSNKISKALNYLVTGHTANLIGSLRYITGLEKGRWQRVTSDE